MSESEMLEMMRRQANSLRVMGEAMFDHSQHEGDAWHVHGIEVVGAAAEVDEWVEEIDK